MYTYSIPIDFYILLHNVHCKFVNPYCHADGFYRVPYSKLMEDEGVPSIPVQPLSYGDAIHFLSQLEEHDVPNSDWEGGLNITYKIAQADTNTK